ncbi:MAG: hypothetical protein HOP08_15890 [Cyclobacteriaceae bacterium]|nr:hypothetical protein [Cyclobacteriaceae bacterium]
MKRNLPIILTLFLISATAYSQTFVRGYIKKNGEKTDGYISYVPSKKKNDVILFKSTEAGASKQLTSEDISGFFLEGYNAEFVSMKDNQSKKIIFTEVIVSGSATLSQFGKRYFVLKGTDTLQINYPLKDKRQTETMADHSDRRLLDIRTVAAVKKLFSDCPDPKIEAKLTNITPGSLANSVLQYNLCKGDPTTSNKSKSKLGIGIVVGYVVPSIKFTEPYVDFYDMKPTLKYGLQLDFIPKQYQTRTALSFQIIIMENKYEKRSDAPSYMNGSTSLDHITLRFPIALKIFMKPGQRGLFLNPGVAPYFVLNNDKDARITVGNLAAIRSYNASYFFGVGYEFDLNSKLKLAPMIKYERMATEQFVFGSSIQYLQLEAALKF